MKAMTEAECKQYMLDHGLSSYVTKNRHDEITDWLITNKKGRGEQAPDWFQAVNQYRAAYGDRIDNKELLDNQLSAIDWTEQEIHNNSNGPPKEKKK